MLKLMDETTRKSVRHYFNREDAPKLLEAKTRAVIVYSVKHGDELQGLVDATRELAPRVATGAVVLLAVNNILHVDVPKILHRMGFREIVTGANLTARGLKFRTDRLLEDVSSEAESEKVDLGLLRGKAAYKSLEGMRSFGDCWLLRTDDDVRRTQGQWVLDIVGPGPNMGRWSRDDSDSWIWTPKYTDEIFVNNGGTWKFHGYRPEFSDCHWQFVSVAPRLVYQENGLPKEDRFWIGEDGLLRLRKNSEGALRKWPSIHSSIEAEYRFPGERAPVRPPSFASLTSPSRLPWRERLGIKNAEFNEAMIKRIEPLISPKAKLFNGISDAVQIVGYLKELDRQSRLALVWSKGQKSSFSAPVEEVDLEKGRIWLTASPDLKQSDLPKLLSHKSDGEFYVNVSLRRANLLFVASFTDIEVERSRIGLRAPSTVYEVQRRGWFRFEIPEHMKIPLIVQGVSRTIVNLSAGGLSYMCKPEEAARLENRAAVQGIEFRIHDLEVRCDGEVRWKKDKNGVAFVGIQFVGLNYFYRERTNLFVLEESFEYLRSVLPLNADSGPR